MKKQGTLVISLDFELFWGLSDLERPQDKREAVENVHTVVPRLLELFRKYGIHATWAAVGGLFAADDGELLRYLPRPMASQTEAALQTLGILPGAAEDCPRTMLYAPALPEQIAAAPHQELATHTYSHYYCDLPDSTPAAFAAELEAGKRIMADKGYVCRSVVFPRNQVRPAFTQEAEKAGLRIYRGVERGWISRISRTGKIGIPLWYLNNYFPLQRGASYPLASIREGGMYNVRNSRFFKPYRPQYRFMEARKLRHYKKEMLLAAQRGEVYHMYWHPVNFGENTEINFAQMEELLSYFADLQRQYGMVSMNMAEAAEAARQLTEQ